MVRKRQSREPLFYIQQPKISKPEAPMQDHYSSPKRTQKESAKQDEGSSTFNMPGRGNNFHQFQNPQPVTTGEQADDEAAEQVQDEEMERDEDDVADTNEENTRSKFKDLTISEKIDYFVHMPPHIPRLKCEVTTEDRTYRGMIIAREEDDEEIIVVRSGKRKFTVPINTITAIRLLGM